MDEWSLKRILIKNIYGGRLLEYFLIASISSILVIRLYLKLTGYPQIGFGHFHIAHVLWGGILMMLGLAFILAYLSSTSRTIGSIIAGIGFGAFIDELGKFITQNNDYFFQPTAAIIYVIFIVLFLIFRHLDRQQDLSKQEYLANALELLEDIVFNDLDTDEKSQIRRLLAKSDSKNPLVTSLKDFINEFEAKNPDPPHQLARLRVNAALFYQKIVSNRWFVRFLVTFFSLNATLSIIEAFQYGRLFFFTNYSTQLGAPAIGEIVFAFVAAIPIVLGTVEIFRNRVSAFRLYRYSILINIFLVQFFEFYQNHFSAVGGLFGNILLLVALNYMISREMTIQALKD